MITQRFLRWITIRFHHFRGASLLASILFMPLAVTFALPRTSQVTTSTITIGQEKLLGKQDSGNGNLLVAQRVTLSQKATLESLSFYVTQPDGRLLLGIYSDSGGSPRDLVASAPVFTPSQGWNTVSVSPVSLVPGTYWLAYLPESSSLVFAMGNSGSARWYSSPFGSLPVNYASSSSRGAFQWSFYATLKVNSNTTPTATPRATSSPTSTALPTATPTSPPTSAPTATPTTLPSFSPTPTDTSTVVPTATPTAISTAPSTVAPTATPTSLPSFTPIATSTDLPSTNIGETNLLSYNDSGNGDVLVAQRAFLSQTSTLSSISFYVRTASGGLQLGIYNDTSGQPTSLIISTPVFNPVVGWNTISLSPINLTQGYYWLAYLPQSNSLGFQADLSSGSARWYSSNFGSMPATFSSSASSGSYHWSFYATLNVSSSSTPTFTPTPTTSASATPTFTPTPTGLPSVTSTSTPTGDPTTTPVPGIGTVYPLKSSANGRYLVDQNGKPFFIVGDSPHGLIGRLSLTGAANYLSSRRNAGVNAMWVELFCSTYSNICPGYTTYDGIAPFAWTNNDPNTFDLSQPNPAYFSRVDAMVNLAAQYGITLFLDPTETGGWLDIYRNNGATKAYNFGVYLGNRYKDFPNIVWQHGNDFQTWTNSTDDNLIKSVANGIRSVDLNHLQTVQLDFQTSASLNDPTWAPYISIDTAYSYYSPYDQVLREYNRSNYLPVSFLEGVYEYQGYSGGYTGPHELRAQEYWTALSGATGAFYGNANLYPFPSGWENTNWQTSPGISQLTYFANLFVGRAWYNLIPDQNHTIVISGYGTYQSIAEGVMGNTSDYATTAITGDGNLMVSYLPTVRTIGVDMSKFSGLVTAKWYDPTSGTYMAVSGSPFTNSGNRQFTPPGNNAGGDRDWILILER